MNFIIFVLFCFFFHIRSLSTSCQCCFRVNFPRSFRSQVGLYRYTAIYLKYMAGSQANTHTHIYIRIIIIYRTHFKWAYQSIRITRQMNIVLDTFHLIIFVQIVGFSPILFPHLSVCVGVVHFFLHQRHSLHSLENQNWYWWQPSWNYFQSNYINNKSGKIIQFHYCRYSPFFFLLFYSYKIYFEMFCL